MLESGITTLSVVDVDLSLALYTRTLGLAPARMATYRFRRTEG